MSAKLENKDTVSTLVAIGKVSIIIAFIIPFSTLILRIVDYELLKLISYDQLIAINPVSAISFMLLSVAVWLVRKEEKGTNKYMIVSDILCILVILVGAGRLITAMLGAGFVLDEALFSQQVLHFENFKAGINQNLMSPITGLLLVSIGASVFLINLENDAVYKVAQFLCYLVTFFSLLSIYIYVYQIEGLYDSNKFVPISVHSALSAFLLASGTLFLRPHKGSMATLVGENSTQIVLLRFLAFFIPLILGGIKLYGESNNWFNKEFGTALYAATTFAISMSLLGWKSNVQHKLKKVNIQNEDQIKKDWERLKKILDQSPTLISIVDIKTSKFTYVNHSTQDTIRIKGKSIKGQKYNDVIKAVVHKDDRQKAIERFDAFKKLKKGEHNELTYRIYDKDGNVTWIFSRAIGIKYRNGEVRQVIASTLNITRQMELKEELKKKNKEIEENNKELNKVNKRLEKLQNNLKEEVKKQLEELKESERACKDFFENSFEGILRYGFKDIDGLDTDLSTEEQIKTIVKHVYIAEANKKLAKIHGYDKPDALIGTPIGEYLDMPEEDKARIIQDFISAGYKLENHLTCHSDKDGKQLKLRTNITGIMDDDKLLGAWATQRLAEDNEEEDEEDEDKGEDKEKNEEEETKEDKEDQADES